LSRRESYRRSLREKGPFSLKMHHPKKIIGEIMKIAKTTVVTMAPTTPVYDAVQIMSKRVNVAFEEYLLPLQVKKGLQE